MERGDEPREPPILRFNDLRIPPVALNAWRMSSTVRRLLIDLSSNGSFSRTTAVRGSVFMTLNLTLIDPELSVNIPKRLITLESPLLPIN